MMRIKQLVGEAHLLAQAERNQQRAGPEKL